MNSEKKSILVLYNFVEKDEYEEMRQVDPASVDFTPHYSIHVATVQEEYSAIVGALHTEGFEARCVNLLDSTARLHEVITQNPPDVIFNLVENFYNDLHREGAVAGFYELHRMRYTGAPAFSLALCRRKGLTKQVLLQNGLATPNYFIQNGRDVAPDHGLKYPLIIKPCWQDGSAEWRAVLL
jgi:D-alanine-D-alanine ligase